MSKVKSPQEKKKLSLTRDRRNTFRENSKASRKGIRRGKQRSHMGQRRAVGQILSRLKERTGENDGIEADFWARFDTMQTLSVDARTRERPNLFAAINVRRREGGGRNSA